MRGLRPEYLDFMLRAIGAYLNSTELWTLVDRFDPNARAVVDLESFAVFVCDHRSPQSMDRRRQPDSVARILAALNLLRSAVHSAVGQPYRCGEPVGGGRCHVETANVLPTKRRAHACRRRLRPMPSVLSLDRGARMRNGSQSRTACFGSSCRASPRRPFQDTPSMGPRTPKVFGASLHVAAPHPAVAASTGAGAVGGWKKFLPCCGEAKALVDKGERRK